MENVDDPFIIVAGIILLCMIMYLMREISRNCYNDESIDDIEFTVNPIHSNAEEEVIPV